MLPAVPVRKKLRAREASPKIRAPERTAKKKRGASPRARLNEAERRAQLLALGRRLFTERPYDALSIDDIAAEAGISKGLLYHYFPSKRDFYVAVVDEAHFTRAAERLHVAQPAISQQIRRLESMLGERLLHRDRRTVSLTPAGEALLPYARAALAQVQHGQQAVAALRGLVTGHLNIGLVMPLPDRRVIRAIGAFGRRYPGIDLTLVEDETDALAAF